MFLFLLFAVGMLPCLYSPGVRETIRRRRGKELKGAQRERTQIDPPKLEGYSVEAISSPQLEGTLQCVFKADKSADSFQFSKSPTKFALDRVEVAGRSTLSMCARDTTLRFRVSQSANHAPVRSCEEAVTLLYDALLANPVNREAWSSVKRTGLSAGEWFVRVMMEFGLYGEPEPCAFNLQGYASVSSAMKLGIKAETTDCVLSLAADPTKVFLVEASPGGYDIGFGPCGNEGWMFWWHVDLKMLSRELCGPLTQRIFRDLYDRNVYGYANFLKPELLAANPITDTARISHAFFCKTARILMKHPRSGRRGAASRPMLTKSVVLGEHSKTDVRDGLPSLTCIVEVEDQPGKAFAFQKTPTHYEWDRVECNGEARAFTHIQLATLLPDEVNTREVRNCGEAADRLFGGLYSADVRGFREFSYLAVFVRSNVLHGTALYFCG
ncbi:hypothetical protein FOZ62_030107 [Perkinsus olseni]|uniref:Uncharacterized protein n=1 Tax=Perkinsus olseni TaxID=32597 RepID=A0A7J6R4G6_PEROL|nr:hypothetical protein FOZ62_030107 [Perkinsus olseni]